MRTIAKVIRFVNGMVMVFDQQGQQMPEYQGVWEEQRELIEQNRPASVTVVGPVEWTHQ